jgi:peroxiredoxin
MKPFQAVALTVLVLAQAAVTCAAEPPQTAATKLEAIKKEFAEAEAAYDKAIHATPHAPESYKKADELWKAFDKKQSDLFLAAVDLAKADPKSDTALDALEWVLTITRAYYLPAGKPAIELATEYHAANPKVARVAAWVADYRPNGDVGLSAERDALLKAVLEKNPDRTARGQVMRGFAFQANCKFARAEYLKSPDTDKLAAEAEQGYEAVLKDYADCPWLLRPRKRSLGDDAKQELYVLRNLRIGKALPEIQGEDMDGAKFKISDYRGKVVMVVCWATWCGPCMRQVPTERKLVERLKDRPFVLIGVNGDDDKGKAKAVIEKEKMTWRSFAGGRRGPIPQALNVSSWPTVYIIDTKGVIRFKDLSEREMDKAIDELIKEVE